MRVDTKQYYIPHTRTRVYLVAYNQSLCASSAELASQWVKQVKSMERPSSSTLEAFLLPSDDPRVHRGRERLAIPKVCPTLSGGRVVSQHTPDAHSLCEHVCRTEGQVEQTGVVVRADISARGWMNCWVASDHTRRGSHRAYASCQIMPGLTGQKSRRYCPAFCIGALVRPSHALVDLLHPSTCMAWTRP